MADKDVADKKEVASFLVKHKPKPLPTDKHAVALMEYISTDYYAAETVKPMLTRKGWKNIRHKFGHKVAASRENKCAEMLDNILTVGDGSY